MAPLDKARLGMTCTSTQRMNSGRVSRWMRVVAAGSRPATAFEFVGPADESTRAAQPLRGPHYFLFLTMPAKRLPLPMRRPPLSYVKFTRGR